METMLSLLPEGVTTHWCWSLTYQGPQSSDNCFGNDDGLATALPGHVGCGALGTSSALPGKEKEPISMGRALMGRHSRPPKAVHAVSLNCQNTEAEMWEPMKVTHQPPTCETKGSVTGSHVWPGPAGARALRLSLTPNGGLMGRGRLAAVRGHHLNHVPVFGICPSKTVLMGDTSHLLLCGHAPHNNVSGNNDGTYHSGPIKLQWS
ncbi:uncharacterized protein LOC108581442 [Papio anubis]|uniref:uncharacterized protein LOC108581442 n=1 Tax=Papio anubis TaxID=9555 RepID=UPI0012ADEBD6|nr:uncharacterized protein LOC108581442 [Papio anubis]